MRSLPLFFVIWAILVTVSAKEGEAKTIQVALFGLHGADQEAVVNRVATQSKSSTKKKTKSRSTRRKEQRDPLLSFDSTLAFVDQRLHQGLSKGLVGQDRFRYLTTEERSLLLNPSWSQAPSTLEEALELGRELGVDWVIQGVLRRVGSESYRINLYLIATNSDELALDSEREALTDGESKGLAPRLVDFNTLTAHDLKLAEHIIWASKLDRLEDQLSKAGLRLLYKAEQRLIQIKSSLKSSEELDPAEEEEEKEEAPRELSLREKRAIELSDAARRELDDIQARLDAENERRREELTLKREALASEASDAWRRLEEISGGVGLKTLVIGEADDSSQQGSRRIKYTQRRPKERGVIRPAQILWSEVSESTQRVIKISIEDHRDLLLGFIRAYENKLPDYDAQVAESKNRFTWLNRTQVEWVPIRGGRFQVGSTFPVRDERPMQWIKVPAFEASISEVTNAQYKLCVDAKVCTPPHWDDKSCEIFTDLHLKRDALPAAMRRGDMPVVCVDWNQANTFAKWVGGRLLSETEWEFIARSGEKSFNYPWGSEEASCGLAVMHTGVESGCGFGTPWPVCSKPQGRNHIGLCDLAGNVWEWVTDQYRPSHEKVPTDGSPFVGKGIKVIKGGSFSSNYKELYASTRGQLEPNGRSNSVGFRVARAEQATR